MIRQPKLFGHVGMISHKINNDFQGSGEQGSVVIIYPYIYV